MNSWHGSNSPGLFLSEEILPAHRGRVQQFSSNLLSSHNSVSKSTNLPLLDQNLRILVFRYPNKFGIPFKTMGLINYRLHCRIAFPLPQYGASRHRLLHPLHAVTKILGMIGVVMQFHASSAITGSFPSKPISTSLASSQVMEISSTIIHNFIFE